MDIPTSYVDVGASHEKQIWMDVSQQKMQVTRKQTQHTAHKR
jgi:hypothetical protein